MTTTNGFIIPPQRFYRHTLLGLLEAPAKDDTTARATVYRAILEEAARWEGKERMMAISELEGLASRFKFAAEHVSEQLDVLRHGRRTRYRDDNTNEWQWCGDADDDDALDDADDEDYTSAPLRDREREAQGQKLLPFARGRADGEGVSGLQSQSVGTSQSLE